MPDCSSLIVSEETGDYIIEYNSLYFEQIQRQDGVCISCINDTWCILYTNYPGSRNINIQQGYYSVPKLYGLMDTTIGNYGNTESAPVKCAWAGCADWLFRYRNRLFKRRF